MFFRRTVVCFFLLCSVVCSQDLRISSSYVDTLEYKQNGTRLIGYGRNDSLSGPRSHGTQVRALNDKSQIIMSCRGFRVQDMTLIKVPLWIKPRRGVGVGHGIIENIAFWEKGIVIGDEAFNGNGADITIRNCWFRNCEAAITITTSQNVNIAIDDCTFNRCKIHLKVDGGGLVTFRKPYILGGGTCIYLTNKAIGTRVGSQNGHFWIYNPIWDQKQVYPTKLLVDESRWGKGRSLTVRDSKFAGNHFKKGDTLTSVRDGAWKVFNENPVGLPSFMIDPTPVETVKKNKVQIFKR